jgi:hypothetical protein
MFRTVFSPLLTARVPAVGKYTYIQLQRLVNRQTVAFVLELVIWKREHIRFLATGHVLVSNYLTDEPCSKGAPSLICYTDRGVIAFHNVIAVPM